MTPYKNRQKNIYDLAENFSGDWGILANKDKSGIGFSILVFGIIFLLVGVTLSFYELMTLFTIPWDGNIPHLFRYPYQFVGIVLILAGIIFAIVGIYLWQSRPKKEI